MKTRRNRGAARLPQARASLADAMVRSLQNALAMARGAGCPRTVVRIRAALASAYGAERAARGRVARAQHQQATSRGVRQ